MSSSHSPFLSPFEFRWDTTGITITSESNRTNAFTNWAELVKICSGILHTPCRFDGIFRTGSHNIMRRLVTTDISPQQTYVVRIPLIPELCEDPRESKDWWMKDEKEILESEVATMRWVHEFLQIPVPEVIAFDSGVGAAGVPWVLMTAIEGHPYTEVKPHILASNGERTKQQEEKVRQAVAWVQIQLSKAPFPSVGMLALRQDNSIYLKTLPGFPSGTSPFASTADYLAAWSRLMDCGTHPGIQLSPEEQEYHAFPPKLLKLVPGLAEPVPELDGFPLIRHDFRFKNMLFDDEFNLVGVVDWRDCFSAPFDIFAARSCMYAVWSKAEARLIIEPEYKQEVARIEAQMGDVKKLSAALESSIGDIGLLMWAYEEGLMGIGYQKVLDRAASQGRRIAAGVKPGFLFDPSIWNSVSQC
ncbi:hypothetical protein BDD12DRAFT_882132 [Trichophaea hybrida]|nr:hypothetical protein BDD12DRAFT_882132 [Trichophaea hybrida]